MDDVAPGTLERFGLLEDSRTGHAGRRELLDIIVITPWAVICGPDNRAEIEEFGKSQKDRSRRFLRLPNRIPLLNESPLPVKRDCPSPDPAALTIRRLVNTVSETQLRPRTS